MTFEQLSPDSEAKLQEVAEIDASIGRIEALVIENDLYELRMAVRVASRLPHFKHVDGANTPETINEQTRREVTDDLKR